MFGGVVAASLGDEWYHFYASGMSNPFSNVEGRCMYHQLHGLISLRRPILRAETAYDTLTILETPPHRTASLTYSWRDNNCIRRTNFPI
jgi:hypothetical protein